MQDHILISKDTLWIYRQDTLVQRVLVRTGQGVREPIVINNLVPGEYQLTFVNMYGQHIDRTISLPDSAEYSYKICPDELVEHPVNTLSRLKTGESVTLHFKQTSCGINGDAQLRITRKNGYFQASLKDHENGKYRKMSVTLSTEMEFNFTRFENELKFIKNAGRCTAQDYYTIASKYGTYAKRDGSCNWDGFYFLKTSLFGQAE